MINKERVAAEHSQLLFGNTYAPITREMLLVNLTPPMAVEYFGDWQRRLVLAAGERLSVDPIDGGIIACLDALPPLSPWPLKDVFVPTVHENWTVIFAGGTRTADHSSFAWILSKDKGLRSIRVIDAPDAFDFDAGKGVYGERLFELRTGQNTEVRGIQLMRTDTRNWEFKQTGTPQPFEQDERYAARRNADRFTHEMLTAYLESFDLRPFDSGFYRDDRRGFLVTRHSPEIEASQRYFSLFEARADQEDFF